MSKNHHPGYWYFHLLTQYFNRRFKNFSGPSLPRPRWRHHQKDINDAKRRKENVRFDFVKKFDRYIIRVKSGKGWIIGDSQNEFVGQSAGAGVETDDGGRCVDDNDVCDAKRHSEEAFDWRRRKPKVSYSLCLCYLLSINSVALKYL